jgi:hypothetical protein
MVVQFYSQKRLPIHLKTHSDAYDLRNENSLLAEPTASINYLKVDHVPCAQLPFHAKV